MSYLVRTDADGRRWHLGQDGWFLLDHAAAASFPVTPGLALQEALELPSDVSPDFSVRDIATWRSRALALLPVVPAHEAPPSKSEAATLNFAGVQNVDR